MDAVKDYTAINDTVFQITLKKPFPAFLGLLTNKYCSVVPKEIVEQLGNKFNQYPIGTGPFYVKMWEPNVKLVLRKNPLYFEQDKKGQSLPYLESVAVSFIQDRQTEFIRFANGYFDMMTGLDASYIQEILTQEGTLHPNYRDSFKLLKNPYLNTEYIGFYVGDKGAEVVPKEIRQAINYAIDRKEMITFLRNGIGIPAEGGFLPSAFLKKHPIMGLTMTL